MNTRCHMVNLNLLKAWGSQKCQPIAACMNSVLSFFRHSHCGVLESHYATGHFYVASHVVACDGIQGSDPMAEDILYQVQRPSCACHMKANHGETCCRRSLCLNGFSLQIVYNHG